MTAAEQERPVRKDVARNRALLLAAAEDVVASRGRETTLDDVARHAGLGVATAYRHFENKGVLLNALFAERLAHVEAVAERLAAAPDAGAALFEFLVEVGRLQAGDRGLRDAMSTTYDDDVLAGARDRLLTLTERMVSRAREAGQVRAEITAIDIPVIITIIAALCDQSGDEAPDLWRRYLDVILGGLGADDVKRPAITVRAPTRELVERMFAPMRPADTR
jgi:AcrR family transcriptional regulator